MEDLWSQQGLALRKWGSGWGLQAGVSSPHSPLKPSSFPVRLASSCSTLPATGPCPTPRLCSTRTVNLRADRQRAPEEKKMPAAEVAET